MDYKLHQSIFDFYAYLFIAYELDGYELFLGDHYYTKALEIISMKSSSNFTSSYGSGNSSGINGKYIQQSISNSHARGFALDLGTLFDTPFGFRLGTSISNFGPKLKMTGDDLLIGADVDENMEGNNDSEGKMCYFRRES